MARSRQHQSHSRALRELLSQPGKALLESVDVTRLLAIQYIQKRIGTGGDHPDAILLVRLRLRSERRLRRQLVKNPTFEALAAVELPVRFARCLTVIGKNIKIIAVLRHVPYNAPELTNRPIDATQTYQRRAAVGTES